MKTTLDNKSNQTVIGNPPMPGYSLNASGGQLILQAGAVYENATKDFNIPTDASFTVSFDLELNGGAEVMAGGPNVGFNFYSTSGTYTLSGTGVPGSERFGFYTAPGYTVIIDNVKVTYTAPSTAVFLADIRQSTDYSPFGVKLEKRDFSLTSSSGNVIPYRYGYQGSEMDNEMKGSGNSYTTEFRQLDPRLGRWLTLDPKMSKYPEKTPYHSMSNNPLMKIDPYGDDDFFDKFGNYLGSTLEGTQIRIITTDVTFDQAIADISNKTTLIVDLDYSRDQESNRSLLSNVATYYAVFAGINEKILVENTDRESSAAFYHPCESGKPPCDDDFFAISVNNKGKISKMFNDKHNLTNVLAHEKNHQDDYSTHKPIDHVNSVIAQSQHGSWKETTLEFKQTQLTYAQTLLNEALDQGVNVELVKERVAQVQNALGENVGDIFYDEDDNRVVAIKSIGEVEIKGNK